MMHRVRLLNKRNKTATYPEDLLIFDIDRTCPIMGNPIHLKDKDNDDERDAVIVEYRELFKTELLQNAKFLLRLHYFAALVREGKKIALRCWCHPKPCHGHVIIEKIHELAGIDMSEQKETTREVPEFLRERFKPEDIDYVECRFAIHMPKRGKPTDYHMVKERVHLKNGESYPNVRYVPNYKRRFWTTRKNLQGTHKQKKEWEYLDNLVEGETTQSDLNFAVARSLGKMHLANQGFALKDSPYVYGLDIPSTVSLKYDYFEKMGDKKHTPFSVAYSDTETNMLDLDQGKSKHIIMQSVFFEGKLYTAVLVDFMKTVPRPKETLREMFEQYMPQQGKDEVKEWQIDFFHEPIEIVKAVLKRCHDWQPDFLTFWNLIYDLDKMIECIENAGYDPAEIFGDPKLPKELRYAYLKRANPSKTSASGKQQTKKPADQWHTYFCSSSFYLIDQMATYRFIRKSKQLEKNYDLDSILKKELGDDLGKLKHAPAEGLTKAEFHIFMQQKYPGEYVIYHCWDVVCMHVLNNQTLDLTYSLPGTTEYSDFVSFESEPKRYVHKFHHYALKKHRAVTGCSGDSLVQEFDKMTIDGKGHIVTLEPHLTLDSGLKIFKDYPGVRTNFYGHNADLDVKASYPYGQWVFNMSRQTCVRELISIEGVRDHVRRIQGLNFSGGRSNAVEFCTEIFKLPTHIEIGAIYDKAMANA